MGLADLPTKRSYNSDVDDILNQFYIPVLGRSVRYDRISGFFSSSSLAAAAKGIAGLIKNGGHMRFITSAFLQREDVDAILKGDLGLDDYLELSLSLEIGALEEQIAANHFKAMAWLIKEQRLEIKIAVVVSSSGVPLDSNEVLSLGIVHQKVGILTDADGNRIAFDGSINETRGGWIRNLEQFRVFRDWIPSERVFVRDDEDLFLSFWENRARRAQVFPLPEAIKKDLVKIAPNSIDEIELGYSPSSIRTLGNEETRFRLWDHQSRAVDRWLASNKRGILAMATGTGKTVAAIACMMDVGDRVVTIISCPQIHLVSQWAGVLESLGVNRKPVICNSSNSRWKEQMSQLLLDFDLGIVEEPVILTTHDTLSSSGFMNRIQSTKAPVLLLVDEVHGAGTPIRSEGLLDRYQYRLGLSATPERPMDAEGTKIIDGYFGGVVFHFSIGDAISSINPQTGKTFLVPYEYHPAIVRMTANEFSEYSSISKKIAKAFYAAENDENRKEYFERLCYERARIVNLAENKMEALAQIVEELRTYGPIRNTVVYCEKPLCNKVRSYLLKSHIRVRKFTQSEGTKQRQELGGLSERDYILEGFARGNPQVITAIRCLDEGVDIPEMTTAIIMASSQNPRQSIQRRGRVLRNAPGKDRARIYDMIVVPPSLDPREVSDLDKKILGRELTRSEYYVEDAINRMEAKKKLANLRRAINEV